MDPEVWLAGSLLGGEHQAGSSFRDWRIDEARKDSVMMEDLVRKGCRGVEGSRTPLALPGGLRLREVVGKIRESSQG